jgi:hypothetical protein
LEKKAGQCLVLASADVFFDGLGLWFGAGDEAFFQNSAAIRTLFNGDEFSGFESLEAMTAGELEQDIALVENGGEEEFFLLVKKFNFQLAGDEINKFLVKVSGFGEGAVKVRRNGVAGPKLEQAELQRIVSLGEKLVCFGWKAGTNDQSNQLLV